MSAELNPLVVWLAGVHWAMPLALKAVATMIGILAYCVALQAGRPWMAALVVVFSVGTGMLGAASNVLTIGV